MPNRTTNSPFDPRAPLSREQLQRYARGELTPAEQHEVELHMENDPLVREAVEGLHQPEALAAMEGLEAGRPATGNGSARPWWVGGGAMILLIATLWWAVPRNDKGAIPNASVPTETTTFPHQTSAVPVTAEQHAAFDLEIAGAEALPESLRSAGKEPERFVQVVTEPAPVVRVDPPAQLDARPPQLDTSIPDEELRTLPAAHGSGRVMFFHDMKLAHPSELYPLDPRHALTERSIDARYPDAQAKADARPDEQAIPYERYFETAMGKYAKGDRQGSLEDLFVVLEQHPEDVNALFYAGLCCYDLGLFPRAVTLLEQARFHHVDTFLEEAEWYHALAYERAQGTAAARPLLNTVIERGGFYAERAKKHLSGQP